MALSYSIVSQTVIGDKRAVVADITFDSSYPTGGLAFAPASIGLTSIDFFEGGIGNVSTAFYDAFYIPSTGKLATKTAGAQTANTTDLSTMTVRVRVIGK